MPAAPRILIVEARYYDDITDMLVKGCVEELTSKGAGYKRIIVPGVLEVPAVIRFALRAMELRATEVRFAGYVAIGCVVRGETDHYDHVCREGIGGLYDLAHQYSLAVGNGILTVNNREQALERADPGRRNAGGRAASACLRMIDVKREFGL